MTDLQELIPQMTMIEQDMNAIERIKRYVQLEQEAAHNKPTDPPAELWPSVGEMSFKGVQLRYRPDLPFVLKGLDFHVKAGEKVGIIGRTGAGKSSLIQAIYRTVEIAAGEMVVDGVNLQSLGLETVGRCLSRSRSNEQLPSRMSIIPQEPFLFSGTVR